MVAGMPSFLKVWSWQGYAGHSFLFGLLSWSGRRDSLVFSSLPFIRTCLLPGQGERLGWCSPLLYSYWLRTSGCCLGAQERWWRQWAQNNNTNKTEKVEERQISFFKRKIGNPPRIVQIKTMCQMHWLPWCSSNKEKWNDFPVHTVQPDWCVMLHLAAIWWACVTTLGFTLISKLFILSSPAWMGKCPWSPTAVYLFAFVSLWDLCLCPALSCTLSSPL